MRGRGNISGVPDEHWNNDVLHELHQVHGSDFAAVDESSLMINPNSGQARANVPRLYLPLILRRH